MTVTTSILPAPIEDAPIIERILAGEKRLFELLVRKYNQRLYRIGMSVLDDEAEAQDAMQTAYIKAYEHLSGFENRSQFSTWLTRIMLNQCLEQKRKAGYRLTGMEHPLNPIHMKTPANELANKELNAILERAIAQLPEKYRLVFMLREIEDLSVRETAETLTIGETNVKVRLNRAKTMLRRSLEGYMKDHVYTFHLSKCDTVVFHVMQQLGIANS
ncbi:sigma-70 family RNA polymerase sigma factor [Chitinophaga caseinilytica]|uniref:Sigma-70 family RNA polymerase sigma factor n=1 Tax=Chitinophaga caseinilytica TaxID=2267521 RepID=A0ABZ2Z090_9BACT